MTLIAHPVVKAVTTTGDIKRLRALGKRGLLQSEVARELGWSETRVRWWVTKLHLPFRTRKYERRAPSPAQMLACHGWREGMGDE